MRREWEFQTYYSSASGAVLSAYDTTSSARAPIRGEFCVSTAEQATYPYLKAAVLYLAQCERDR
jgi:hypothetical protein